MKGLNSEIGKYAPAYKRIYPARNVIDSSAYFNFDKTFYVVSENRRSRIQIRP